MEMIVREHYELLQTNKSEIYKIEIGKILWKRQITNTNTFKMLADGRDLTNLFEHCTAYIEYMFCVDVKG